MNGLSILGIRNSVAPPTGPGSRLTSIPRSREFRVQSSLQTDVQGKTKLLQFTLRKTDEGFKLNSALATNRYREALNNIVESIDQ